MLLVMLVAGCSGGGMTAHPSNGVFSISPGVAVIDTNCTGCNAGGRNGAQAEQFRATRASSGAAQVQWSLSGGDATSGPGTITDSGLYTPPSYLTVDSVQVAVTATLKGSELTATSVLTITPGFLQPLAPENVALGANGSMTVTGYLAEAGGASSIRFMLASSPTGRSGGMGTLSGANCRHEAASYTRCTVTYTAPALIASTGSTWLVARASNDLSLTATQILLNTAHIASTPAAHQIEQNTPVLLGSSGGSNRDYDVAGGRILDCCSGTLGALVRDSVGHQYLLSNNHVLARSDQGAAGDAIIQPGLIDNSCTPNGAGAGTMLVGALAHWLPLRLGSTNVDAALARINVHAVDGAGAVLELGAPRANGTLAAAPPGVSSSGGKGEPAMLQMRVAKSGRTTGLTCGAVSAVALDIEVAYYSDCAETKPYLTKSFRNQIAVSGNQFSDAGDSGSLLVDAANAEPVGLLFAGGTDVAGVVEAVANPAGEVLSALGAAADGGFRFTGANDHAVSCLSYGNNTAASALAHVLKATETGRVQRALAVARGWVNPAAGILGVAAGKSVDQPGAAAIIFFVAENHRVALPALVDGVRTVVVATTTRAVAQGAAPESPLLAGTLPALPGAVFAQALAVKQQMAAELLRRQPAFFGVGVGQSYDNPAEAALVIYVDKHQIPEQLPASYRGVRARYIFMDRLHVTRSYLEGVSVVPRCVGKQGREARDSDGLGNREQGTESSE
jgi:hypothetical protein